MSFFKQLLLFTTILGSSVFLWVLGPWNLRRTADLTRIYLEKISSIQLYAKKEEPVLKLLLVTYLRGGSSFLGDLMQSGTDTFYVFEPLLYLTQDEGKVEKAKLRNQIGKEDTISSEQALAEDQLDFLGDIFNCNFQRWPGYVRWIYTKRQQLNVVQRNREYWHSCFKDKNRNVCYKIDYLTSQCQKSKYRIIKSTRISVQNVGSLLDRLPEVKVIHLARDPRGVLSSRHRKPISEWCRVNTICWKAQPFCNLLKSDILSSCTLQSEHSDRFVFLRYEDLACSPLQVSKKLFRFLGMPFESGTRLFIATHTTEWDIRNRTAEDGEHEEFLLPIPYTTRRVSKEVPFMWQYLLTDMEIFRVEKFCEIALRSLRLPLTEEFEPGVLNCSRLSEIQPRQPPPCPKPL